MTTWAFLRSILGNMKSDFKILGRITESDFVVDEKDGMRTSLKMRQKTSFAIRVDFNPPAPTRNSHLPLS